MLSPNAWQEYHVHGKNGMQVGPWVVFFFFQAHSQVTTAVFLSFLPRTQSGNRREGLGLSAAAGRAAGATLDRALGERARAGGCEELIAMAGERAVSGAEGFRH
jgi:hypothetical protein